MGPMDGGLVRCCIRGVVARPVLPKRGSDDTSAGPDRRGPNIPRVPAPQIEALSDRDFAIHEFPGWPTFGGTDQLSYG